MNQRERHEIDWFLLHDQIINRHNQVYRTQDSASEAGVLTTKLWNQQVGSRSP